MLLRASEHAVEIRGTAPDFASGAVRVAPVLSCGSVEQSARSRTGAGARERPEAGRLWAALALAAAIVLWSGSGGAHSVRADATTCAATVPASPTAPAASAPCWTETTPYPFSTAGVPVEDGCACAPLQVTSLAFRAWNRGLAATRGSSAFGVWIFNGTRWFPDPVFPGSRTCAGTKVLWAGKLDYWLVGGGLTWPALCRFDGSTSQWEPMPVPPAAIARATLQNADGTKTVQPGTIVDGACSAWNDCWFFGSLGTILRWDGKSLVDVSPPLSSGWRAGAFNGAAVAASPAGI